MPASLEMVLSKVSYAESGCWEWTGYCARNGYGHIHIDGAPALVHRVSLELHKGQIPEGLVIDHLCRVRNCVNPDHLEPVTTRENVLRGEGIAAKNARKTHCPKGHEYTPENTRTDGGKRACRACHRINQAAYVARRRTA